MPEHPKIVGLSDKAFRALIELWCYCGRNLTDGKIPAVVAARQGKKSITELEKAGLITSVVGDWLCHDYLEHQRSADEVAALRLKRQTSGSKGGLAKAVANAKQVPAPGYEHSSSKSLAETDTEKELLETSSNNHVPRKRGKRITEQWKPTEADIAWQRGENITDAQARRETEKFVSYFLAAPSPNGVKLDWSQAWKNWIRRVADEQTPKAQTGSERPKDWQFG